MSLDIGTQLGSYEILAPLAAGGMGELYRARHVKLGREVAIKILPPDLAADPTGVARFEREARTASSLNHPNIVTIHDIGEQDGTTWIAMELVEGETLESLMRDGPLSIREVLTIGRQIADGLARAHEAGIVHRDLKPSNIMVTADGLVKVLDFGLAKPLRAPDGVTRSRLSIGTGSQISGTPQYMSPEQWAGDEVDHRSDQFSFGLLLFELATGERPFDAPTLPALMTAVVSRRAPQLRSRRTDAPPELERLVARCLEKEPAQRFESTDDLARGLRACADRLAAHRPRTTVGAHLRRPAVSISLAAALVLALAGAGLWVAGAEARWALGEAPAEITALIDAGENYEAFRLAREAKRAGGDSAAIDALLDRMTMPALINSVPEGAMVSMKGYDTPGADWEPLGITPLSGRRPYATVRLRLEKDGYEPVEGAPFSGASLAAYTRGIVLDPVGERPEGMVRIPGGTVMDLGVPPVGEGPLAVLESYFLDRYEVTNREYQAFVDAGGYRDPDWWPTPMERDGREVAWEDAVTEFRDATGRPGPSGWSLGEYPPGEADHPVGGLSWFEAAAYCAFANRSLPTVYHWNHAVGQEQLSDILLQSNIDGTGVAPVGQFAGLAAYGTYDMAGNVKEWTWNATDDRRYILGAAWDEPRYLFRHLIAQDPWGREPTNGVRCASYPEPLPESQLAALEPVRDYVPAEPLTDREFELVRGLYAYDRDSLDARIESVNDSLPSFRWETVSFNTAYGGRMRVHLLIPHDARPPYQSVLWFPGGDVFALRSSQRLSSSFLVDFIPRTGRVLVHPVYHGMYERFESRPATPIQWRDAMIRWYQDIGRTLDYLETREDFAPDRIAYYGFSSGATFGPIFTALEPRFATAVYLGGGLVPVPHRPEAYHGNFAPRSTTPSLLVNGRDDFIMPYETSQVPFFEQLGAAEQDKRHAVLTGGHIPDRLETVREVLDWLDERLGPVPVQRPVAGGNE